MQKLQDQMEVELSYTSSKSSNSEGDEPKLRLVRSQRKEQLQAMSTKSGLFRRGYIDDVESSGSFRVQMKTSSKLPHKIAQNQITQMDRRMDHPLHKGNTFFITRTRLGGIDKERISDRHFDKKKKQIFNQVLAKSSSPLSSPHANI